MSWLKMQNRMKKRVYISFPIGKRDLDERRAFAEKREKYLREIQGYEVVNPLKNGLPPEAHWRDHMRQDFRLMLDCDMVFFCKDWQSSTGCQLEHSVAVACGIDIVYENSTWTPWTEDNH